MELLLEVREIELTLCVYNDNAMPGIVICIAATADYFELLLVFHGITRKSF